MSFVRLESQTLIFQVFQDMIKLQTLQIMRLPLCGYQEEKRLFRSIT